MKHERILFLDFDGVLNTPSTWTFDWARDGRYRLDVAKVQMISDLVNEEDAYIVISSAWRNYYSLNTLIKLLGKRGLKDARKRVIGKTPTYRDMRFRGVEIMAWLHQHPSVTSYVAIDDNDWLEGMKHRWVRTDFRKGVTRKTIEAARRHLRTPDHELRKAS